MRAAYAVAPVLLLGLGACSSPDVAGHGEPDPSAAASALADAGTWNPCTDLAAGPVGRALGDIGLELREAGQPRSAALIAGSSAMLSNRNRTR